MIDENSAAAHRKIRKWKMNMYSQILVVLNYRGPMSREQVQDELGMITQTASARFSELLSNNHVEHAGKTKTAAGHPAWVFAITDKGKHFLKAATK